jgi:hypothetical protein
MENGASFLEDLYYETVKSLSEFSERLELEVRYSATIHIENLSVSKDTYTIPFSFHEVPKLLTSLEKLAAEPRSVSMADLGWRIYPLVLANLKQKAMHRWNRRRNFAWWSKPPALEILTNLAGNLFYNSSRAKAAQRCAQGLIDWITRDELSEFGQRDAERATRQLLHGQNSDGGGVADALLLLMKAQYVHKCIPLSRGFGCRLPSPWFLVNPLWSTVLDSSGTSSHMI